ncbi:SLOG family protein [Amycolatopsis sp. NPDC006131]|uniref:SLOG family protein n=1 Tax=Amycolatopsis sp. NPDC006131 TaxID=3156731 RepID=UPI0033B4CAAE
MSGPRILLTISRTWTQWSTVRRAMTTTLERYPDAVLVHGDDPDSDRKAAGIWKSLGGTQEPVPADWDHCDPEQDVACRKAHRKQRRDGTWYCPTAGLRRNTAMLESGPDLCLSFIHNRSRGASDCTRKAKAVGILVVPYTTEEHV